MPTDSWNQQMLAGLVVWQAKCKRQSEIGEKKKITELIFKKHMGIGPVISIPLCTNAACHLYSIFFFFSRFFFIYLLKSLQRIIAKLRREAWPEDTRISFDFFFCSISITKHALCFLQTCLIWSRHSRFVHRVRGLTRASQPHSSLLWRAEKRLTATRNFVVAGIWNGTDARMRMAFACFVQKKINNIARHTVENTH